MSKQLPAIPTALIFVVWLMGSCSAGKIYLSVLKPATVSIPGTIRTLSIIPLAGLPDPPGEFDSIRLAELDPGYDYNFTKKGFIYGVYEVLSSSPRFQKVVITDSAIISEASAGIISIDLLKQICRHDSTDAALVLKKVVSYDTLLHGHTEMVQNGRYECNLIYKVISRTRWAIYQPDPWLETPVFFFADTVFHYEEGGCDKIYSSKDMRELLYNTCFFAGSAAGKMLVPVWDNEAMRHMYAGADKELRNAAKLVKTDRWEEAGQIWYRLSDNNNKKLASRASFNMALAWERDDDLDQALLWVSHADSLSSNRKTVAYKKILQERLLERTELDYQMNVE